MKLKSILTGLCVLLLGEIVLAGDGGYVTLINATPYNWSLTSSKSSNIDWDFPSIIPAGSSHEQYLNFARRNRWNSAEATFSLLNAPQSMSFTVRAYNRPNRHVEIKYGDHLSSLNNPLGSVIDLGWIHDGAVLFTLAGLGTDDQPFVSTNPPVAWMQSTLNIIGSQTLREISMPASHDSGLSEVSGHYGGIKHNTATQTLPVFDQLRFGARWFDIRPISFSSTFWTGHFTKTSKGAMGCTGRSLNKIVDDINRFNEEYPGELIVLNISHDMNSNKQFKPFNHTEWQKLHQVLNQINDLWIPITGDVPEDLSTLPLSSFITSGSKSAVLVRIPSGASLPGGKLPKRYINNALEALSPNTNNAVAVSGPKSNALDRTIPPSNPIYAPSAFFNEARLPQSGSWSNAQKPSALIADQLSKLARNRTSRFDPVHMSVWTISQKWSHVVDVANSKHSIVNMAVRARRALYGHLWAHLDGEKWPNSVETDDVRDSGVVGLVMAINRVFVNPGPGEGIEDLRGKAREVGVEKRGGFGPERKPC